MRKLLALVLPVVLTTGCAVGPNYVRPPVTTPESIRGQVGSPEAASLADQAWWEIFRDESLKLLIDEALRSGYATVSKRGAAQWSRR